MIKNSEYKMNAEFESRPDVLTLKLSITEDLAKAWVLNEDETQGMILGAAIQGKLKEYVLMALQDKAKRSEKK